MLKNLVIVESPAKAKTIENFLGKDFTVKSSLGHIRDLSKKNFGVDIEHGFAPQYEISPDKVKLVKELKKIVKKTETVWLATDEDREGEAISWHLAEVLKLEKKNTKRIVFHEITKTAITNAISNPRDIDQNLVDAQQARRVLDRLVGFELSPVLWRKIKPSLSAGRVQSVSVRLIVEREKEIKNFNSLSNYKIVGFFKVVKDNKPYLFKAELSKKFKNKKDAVEFLEKCKDSNFSVSDIEVKKTKKSPAPPFTTSTLQQEASRKLGYSVSRTMQVAQRLYEAGFITYMRTDSVNLSELALATAAKEINSFYGEKYLKTRRYKTTKAGAQEAHEAIRPSYINKHVVSGENAEKKLYELIWKRTISSQMANAEIDKTIVSIKGSKIKEKFVARGEVIKFDGFLKVYLESTDDESADEIKGLLPPFEISDAVSYDKIFATEKFSLHPPRYTEASLVKKMEDLGIGRPSTYAPTISTIQKRGYITNESRDGIIRDYNYVCLKNNEISQEIRKEKTGFEKSKLFPTDIGVVVNDFLCENFKKILDYKFTASFEKELDDIANGLSVWNEKIKEFYTGFHKQVEDTLENANRANGQRLLGLDPKTSKNIYVKIGRFGPMVQLGETEDEEKPRFAGLKKEQSIETISLEQAIELFKFPRLIGEYEDADLTVAIGRFGPYIRHKSLFYSIKKEDDPKSLIQKRAIEIIEEKRKKDREKTIKIFEEDETVKILNGRWGPYVSKDKMNFRIPKDVDPKSLSLIDCLELVAKSDKTKTRKSTTARKTTTRKTTAKKTTAKKATAKKATAKKATAKKTTVKKTTAKKATKTVKAKTTKTTKKK